MKKLEFLMFKNYLQRFLDGSVPTKQKLSAIKRYFIMALELIVEKIKGVDYNMVYNTEGDGRLGNGSYTKVPAHVLNKIFADINFNDGEKSFFDVGSGKGYAIKKAYGWPFSKCGGIEYNQHLFDVCCLNLKKEGYTIENIYHGDAVEFQSYDDYNVFFFNSPLAPPLLNIVLKSISVQNYGKRVYLYYLNMNSKKKEEAFSEAGFFLKKKIDDKYESYFDIFIYTNQKDF